jgi:hypothetical protein
MENGKNAYRILVEKLLGQHSFGGQRMRWKENIKM